MGSICWRRIRNVACCLGILFYPAADLWAADLQAIRQRGYLIVAVKDNLRPLGFRDRQGHLQGLEIDLARRLAQEWLGRGDAVVFKPVANPDRLSVITDHQADLAIAKITQTAARSRIVTLTAPYYRDGMGLITRDRAIRSVQDLKDRPVAVLTGSSTIDLLKYSLPNLKLVSTDSYQTAHQLLESGQVVAFAGDISVLSGWLQEFPQYQLLPEHLVTESLVVALPKGVQYEALRQSLNELLDRWRRTGWLQERATYWGLPWDTLRDDP